MTSTPLKHFLSYFHQDWDLEYKNESELINDYVRTEPHGHSVVVEIHRFLREHRTEAETARYLDSIGNEYRADWDGGTYRGWLHDMADALSEALARVPPQRIDDIAAEPSSRVGTRVSLEERYPGLWLLMGAYFYEDWPFEYGDIWTALDDFMREPHAAEVVPEIQALLALSEDELAAATERMGAAYDPTHDGGTYRGWLEEVSRRVTVALESKP